MSASMLGSDLLAASDGLSLQLFCARLLPFFSAAAVWKHAVPCWALPVLHGRESGGTGKLISSQQP